MYDRNGVEKAQTARTAAGPVLLRAPLYVVPALLLAGALWPGSATWGVSQWSSFPTWITAAAITLYFAVALISALSLPMRNRIDYVIEWAVRSSQRVPTSILYSGLSILFFAVFVYFGSRAYVYGDGFTIVANSAKPLLPLPTGIHEISKFLPVMLYRLGHLVFSQWWGVSSELAFRMTSSIGGVVGIWGLVKAVSHVTEDIHRRTAIALGTLSSGCTLLFFGYAELYTFGICATLWLLAFVLGFIKGRNRAWPVITTAIVLLASNFMLAPLAIVALLVVGRGANFGCERQLSYPWAVRPSYMNLAIVLSSALLFWLLRLIEPSFYSVPLLPGAGHQYWALSIPHLLDLVNLLFLVAPVSIGLLAIPFLRYRAEMSPEADPMRSFLATTALVSLLLSFWIDPLMGSPRDWDLLSTAGFPLSLLSLYYMTAPNSNGTRTGVGTGALAAFALLLLLPNIHEKGDLRRAAVRVDGLLWNDPHYQTDYDKAYRCISWGALLRDKLERPDLAVKYFKRRLEVDSLCDICLYDLGKEYLDRKVYDSAANYLSLAASLMPLRVKPVAAYAYVLQILGDSTKASSQIDRVWATDCRDAEAEQLIAMTCFGLGKHDQALEHFRRCLKLEPQGWAPKANIALAFSKLGVGDSSVVYYLAALTSAPTVRRQALYSALIQEQVALGRLQGARQTLADLLREFPGALDAHRLNALIDANDH